MMFLDVCTTFKHQTHKTAYAQKHNDSWHHVSHDVLRESVECFAFGLIQLGLVRGERVGLISENRLEWPVVDFALSAIGAVDVPIFPTLTAPQAQYIFQNCNAACVIVSSHFQLTKIEHVWDELPDCRFVIVLNNEPHPHPNVYTYDEIVQRGRAVYDAEKRTTIFAELCKQAKPEDLLTLIYTSGTTGPPKGVMLSHANITSNIQGALASFDVNERDVFLSYLPTCHAYERMSGYYLAFAVGATTFISESIDSVANNMLDVRPTIMTSIPRLFERIKARVLASVERESAIKQKLFYWAIDIGKQMYYGTNSTFVRLQYKLADKLVLQKIRNKTGGRIRFFVSGGAALHPEVGEFFFAIGLHILEGYGLTETSPVLSVNRLYEEKLGTVGTPLSNVQIRIAPDGEILAKGPNIMLGYWQNEAATLEVLDEQGWFHTGDIGEFTTNGYLRITDRKKHLLVTSGGKNIAPLAVEAVIMQSSFVDQVVVFGDGRDFCTALIVPDEHIARRWFTKHNKPTHNYSEMLADEEFKQAVFSDIQKLQAHLAKYERVRRFSFVEEPFSVHNQMLTPTLKVRRKAVLQAYEELVEQMYVV